MTSFIKNLNSTKNIKYNLSFFINLFFCTFPYTYIFGNLIVNLNLLIFCFLGLIYLKKKIFNINPNYLLKLTSIFFLLVFFSTLFIYIETFHLDQINYKSSDPLTNLNKSLIFFRYLILLFVVYSLNNLNVINFKYFFYSASIIPIFISLDVIFQYFFGFNIIGMETNILGRNSSFFGDEAVAGSFILRFCLFSILLTYFLTEKNSSKNLLYSCIIIYISALGILLSGNRMPLIIFLLGLILIFISFAQLRKTVILALCLFLISSIIIGSFDNRLKNNYYSFYQNSIYIINNFAGNVLNSTKDKKTKNKSNQNIEDDYQKLVAGGEIQTGGSGHISLYLTAIDTWKINKIFGGGIKSFRNNCHFVLKNKILDIRKTLKIKLGEKAESNIPDSSQIIRTNIERRCATHPHNYYLEILTETGLLGFCIFILIVSIIIKIFIKSLFSYKKRFSFDNLLFYVVLINLILELFPIRSTGSFFTTSNAIYTFLMLSILQSNKKLFF